MAVCGRFTDCDLSDLTALTLPWQMENGQLRPSFSRTAAQLSLELSYAAYHLDEERWARAGWQDILYRGAYVDAAEDEAPAGLTGRVQGLFHWIRHNVNAVTRNRDEKKLDKVLVMAHPLPDGRHVIAVGLMGTEKRVSDWAVNLRLGDEDGLHRGFASASRRLEEVMDQVTFRETARLLGQRSLTLSDVVRECCRPGSRFVLWLSGHSQGGAVMQVFALHLTRMGVLPRHLVGYGFASPRVLYAGFPGDISDFPIFHILNRDDMVPKVGALLHIGRCQIYSPDERTRAFWYGEAWNDEAFRRLFAQTSRVHSTRDGIVFLYALLLTVRDTPSAETIAAISESMGRHFPNRLSDMLSGRIDSALTAMMGKLESVYLSVSDGEPLSRSRMELFHRRLTLEMEQTGPRTFIRYMTRILYGPHRLAAAEEGALSPSYAFLVSNRFYALRPCLSGDETPLWRGKRGRLVPPRGTPGRFGLYTTGRRTAAMKAQAKGRRREA